MPVTRPITDQFWLNATLFWTQNGQLVTAANPNRLLTWDVAKGEVVAEVDFPAEAAFALSPDGSEIVTYPPTTGSDECFNFLDAATGKSIRRGTPRGKGAASGVALSPDGQQVVTSAKGCAGAWNANTGQPVARNGNAGDFRTARGNLRADSSLAPMWTIRSMCCPYSATTRWPAHSN